MRCSVICRYGSQPGSKFCRRWCRGRSATPDVTRVLQGCYKSVTRVLRGVTRMLQGCYKGELEQIFYDGVGTKVQHLGHSCHEKAGGQEGTRDKRDKRDKRGEGVVPVLTPVRTTP
jgi:hypothetical protein